MLFSFSQKKKTTIFEKEIISAAEADFSGVQTEAPEKSKGLLECNYFLRSTVEWEQRRGLPAVDNNMEIIIRGIEKNVIATIDDMAQASGKSRNTFLKEQIELLARAPQLRQQEDKYEILLKEMAMIIQKNTDVFRQLIE